MFDKRQDAFANLHPITLFIYFVIEFVVLMWVSVPWIQVVGLVGAIAYGSYIFRVPFLKTMLSLLPIAILVMCINPLFSHQGATILLYFKDGNPLTLESIYYGIGMGILMYTTLLWFIIVSHVFHVDKWIELLGRVFPRLALLLSMILGLLPKLRKQYQEFRYLSRASSMKKFSMLLSWGLENSVDTADSMSARGYGLSRKRSSYHIQSFSVLDGKVIMMVCILGMLVLGLYVTEQFYFYYYPVLVWGGSFKSAILGGVGFGFYSMIPVIVDWMENIKWKYLQSNM